MIWISDFARCVDLRDLPFPHAAQPLSVVPDISAIDGRLVQLRGIALSSAYAKQRESLKKEFSAFLCSLPGAKTLFSATPKDVCRFLAWKDSRGKTQVHVSTCPYLGKHKVHSCGCPVRLSYTTVDSYIGKLRAIFKDAGREGDWNTALSLGNPAASAEVKGYLKAFTSEQLQAAVTPKQALPHPLRKLRPSKSSDGVRDVTLQESSVKRALQRFFSHFEN